VRYVKFSYLFIAMIILVSCGSNKPVPLTDLEIKEIAWDFIGDSQDQVIGSEDDIIRKDKGTGVTTIINGAAEDVWKHAEITSEYNKEKIVEFKTMLGPTILVYVDVSKGKAIKLGNKFSGTLNY
jgi:hypothetical protein